MIDNFAAVTCLLRGLFGWEADANGLTARPQIPEDISTLHQHFPVYFGGCRIYAAYTGGNGALTASLNGTVLPVKEDGSVDIPAELLPCGGEVCLHFDRSGADVPLTVSDLKTDNNLTGDIEGLPEELAAIYRDCAAKLETETDPLTIAHLKEVLSAAEAAALRRRLPFDRHELRPMTDAKIEGILYLYDHTVKELYNGLQNRFQSDLLS